MLLEFLGTLVKYLRLRVEGVALAPKCISGKGSVILWAGSWFFFFFCVFFFHSLFSQGQSKTWHSNMPLSYVGLTFLPCPVLQDLWRGHPEAWGALQAAHGWWQLPGASWDLLFSLKTCLPASLQERGLSQRVAPLWLVRGMCGRRRWWKRHK